MCVFLKRCFSLLPYLTICLSSFFTEGDRLAFTARIKFEDPANSGARKRAPKCVYRPKREAIILGSIRFHQKFESVYGEGDPYVILKLNGHIRTVLRCNSAFEFEYNREYLICNLPEQWEDDRFLLRVNETFNECEEL